MTSKMVGVRYITVLMVILTSCRASKHPIMGRSLLARGGPEEEYAEMALDHLNRKSPNVQFTFIGLIGGSSGMDNGRRYFDLYIKVRSMYTYPVYRSVKEILLVQGFLNNNKKLRSSVIVETYTEKKPQEPNKPKPMGTPQPPPPPPRPPTPPSPQPEPQPPLPPLPPPPPPPDQPSKKPTYQLHLPPGQQPNNDKQPGEEPMSYPQGRPPNFPILPPSQGNYIPNQDYQHYQMQHGQNYAPQYINQNYPPRPPQQPYQRKKHPRVPTVTSKKKVRLVPIYHRYYPIPY